ncbi:hypothetical protein FQN54_000488 [Arachnomyces sp. PD_36]|nr:hypothetical protein FQN54_000488 [Arachnomyces sp. PD_36]
MGWIYNASPEVTAQSSYPAILAVCLVLTTIMTIVVSLRIYIHVRSRRLAADDYVIFMSMIFSIIYNATCITQTRYGLGLPLDARPKANLSTYLKVNFAGRPFYQLGIAGFKAALCISYLRLLSGTSERFYKTLIWVVGIISTLGHIAGAIVLIVNCRPVRASPGRNRYKKEFQKLILTLVFQVEASWNSDIKGTCLPFGPTNYGLAGFTIACDVVIIALPIPLLLKLNIRTAQKTGLVCLFVLGILTTICSIMRITQVPVIAYGDGNSTQLVLWGTIEFNVGVSLASVYPILGTDISRFDSIMLIFSPM